MQQKNKLRKKYFNLRKKRYFKINKNFFLPLIQILKKKNKKFLKVGIYYPSNFEVHVLKMLENSFFNSKIILLPVVEDNNQMNFFSWKKNQALFVNKFGMVEPEKTIVKIPDIIIVPILAYDNNKFRLGYGKGFYDRYLNKYLRKFKNIITVGVAFSFQKYNKLPTDKNDVRLNFIITEKGIF